MKVIVTGSSSGIGKYIVEHIDDTVLGLDIKENVDVSNYSQLSKYLSQYNLDDLNLIINCAAIRYNKPFYEYNSDEFNKIVSCNIKTGFNLSKLCKPYLASNKGNIINISSVHSTSTLDKFSIYAMTKGAIESMTRGFAIELSKLGIRVNCIRLGSVDTEMLDYKESEVNKIPLKHTCRKEDIMKTIHYICDTQFMTGSCITLDGGVLSKLSIDM